MTCDLYSFHPKRRNECVCYPVYSDHVTSITAVVQGMYRALETTSVYYPPIQVIESCLLAAAAQGPPAICDPHRSKCQESAEVLYRTQRVSGDFPYCPTPGLHASSHQPIRTIAPWRSHHTTTVTVTSSNDWGPLPTGSDCKRDGEEKSLCKNDKCMWGFLKPWESPTVRLVTVTGANGVSLFGSVKESVNITTPHWGFLAPATTTRKSTTTTSSYDTSKFKSKKPESSAHSTSPPAPVCTNELDCREYCEKRIKAPKKHMMALLVGGTAFTGIAGLAMLLKIYSKHIHRWCRARHDRRRSAETYIQPSMDDGSVQGLQLAQARPVQARSRGHVRFQVDGADSAVDVLDDTDYVPRRSSGHEFRF